MLIKGVVEVILSSANTIAITLLLTGVISLAPIEGMVSIGGFSINIGSRGPLVVFLIFFGITTYRSYDRIHCNWP